MAENTTVSIDIETADAQKNIAALEKELKRLEAELSQTQKATDKYKRTEIEATNVRKNLTNETNRLQKSVNGLSKTPTDFNKSTRSVMNFAAKGNAGVGGLSKAMQGLSSQITQVAGSFSFTEIAVGGLAAAGAVLVGMLTDFMLAQTDVAESSKAVTAELFKERETLDSMAGVLLDSNSSLVQRKAALMELQNTYGDYLPKLDIEKASIADIQALYNGLNQILLENVLKREKQKAVQTALSEVIANEIDAIEKRKDAENSISESLNNSSAAWLKYLPVVQQGILATESIFEARAMIAESTAKSSREALGDIQNTFDQLGANLAGLDLSSINQTTRQEMERLASAYKFMVEYAKRTGTELDTQSIENRIKALGAIVRKEEKDAQKALDDANKRANDERKRLADEQKRISDSRIADNSIVDLRNKVAALRKELEQYTSTTDAETQKSIANRLKIAQTALDDAEKYQKALLENEKSAAELQLAELQRVQLVKDAAFEREMLDIEERKRAALSGLNDELVAAKVNKSFADEVATVERNNAQRVNASQIEILKKEREILAIKGESVEKIDLQIAQLERQALALRNVANIEKDANAIKLANLERDKMAAANAIEAERNVALASTQTKADIDKINAQYDQKQAQTTARNERNILQFRKEMIQQAIQIEEATGKSDGLKVAELRKDLEEINGQILQTDKAINTSSTDVKQDLANKVAAYTEFAANIVMNVTDILSTIENAQTAAIDERIAKSKSALEELLSNTETTNVRQIELEKERLNALQKEREKSANREVVIANIRIAADLAVGIAKAVAEGGGIGSIATVGAALTAAALGFAQAKAQAKNAYYNGTTYLTDSKAPKGRDKINIWANEGEAIIPTATNAKYSKTVDAIYYGTVPHDVLNSFVDAYQNNLPFAGYLQPNTTIVTADNAKTNALLQSIDNKLDNQKGDTVHLTEKGVRRFTTNATRDDQRKRNRRGK